MSGVSSATVSGVPENNTAVSDDVTYCWDQDCIPFAFAPRPRRLADDDPDEQENCCCRKTCGRGQERWKVLYDHMHCQPGASPDRTQGNVAENVEAPHEIRLGNLVTGSFVV